MYTRIKQILDYSGLNQQEFAEKIAVAPATLSNILKGRVAKYNTDLVMSIRAVFPNIDFEWLLTGNGQMLKQLSSDAGARSNDSETESDKVENEFLPDSDSSLAYRDGVDNYPMRIVDGNNGDMNSGYSGAAAPQAYPNAGSSRTNQRSAAGASGRRSMNANTTNPSSTGCVPGYPSQNLQNMAIKIIDKNIRSIKEIRVFFDDDTFEVFVPSK